MISKFEKIRVARGITSEIDLNTPSVSDLRSIMCDNCSNDETRWTAVYTLLSVWLLGGVILWQVAKVGWAANIGQGLAVASSLQLVGVTIAVALRAAGILDKFLDLSERKTTERAAAPKVVTRPSRAISSLGKDARRRKPQI